MRRENQVRGVDATLPGPTYLPPTRALLSLLSPTGPLFLFSLPTRPSCLASPVCSPSVLPSCSLCISFHFPYMSPDLYFSIRTLFLPFSFCHFCLSFYPTLLPVIPSYLLLLPSAVSHTLSPSSSIPPSLCLLPFLSHILPHLFVLPSSHSIYLPLNPFFHPYLFLHMIFPQHPTTVP